MDKKFLVGRVIKLEPEVNKKYKSGFGKDAEFEEIQIGWKLILDTGFSFIFNLNSKPDAFIGDEVSLEFWRSKHKSEK